MPQHVSLRDANQHLSRYIEAVQTGEEIIITRRGQPVARLLPIPTEKELSDEQIAARERSRKRMQRGFQLGGEGVRRESLYER